MKKLTLLFLLFLITVVSLAQDSIIKLEWKDLDIENYEEYFSEELQGYHREPIYNEKQIFFDNKKIEIIGFLHQFNKGKPNSHYYFSEDKKIKSACYIQRELISLSFKNGTHYNDKNKKTKIIGVIKTIKKVTIQSLEYEIEVTSIEKVN